MFERIKRSLHAPIKASSIDDFVGRVYKQGGFIQLDVNLSYGSLGDVKAYKAVYVSKSSQRIVFSEYYSFPKERIDPYPILNLGPHASAAIMTAYETLDEIREKLGDISIIGRVLVDGIPIDDSVYQRIISEMGDMMETVH